MISDRFPGLTNLSTEEKNQLIREIWQSLIKDEAPELPADFVELLNEQVEYQLAHPCPGTQWDDIWECIEQKKAELRASS